MFSELLLKRNIEDLRLHYIVGGFISLVVWAESDLISVDYQRDRELRFIYTLYSQVN